jgi:hypothetical protein
MSGFDSGRPEGVCLNFLASGASGLAGSRGAIQATLEQWQQIALIGR